ncbi:hypothetical protein [Proteus columbae]|uniref:hypothetical protein n=1 Tax=Proteus columbae TaxID=1987580 RepID=UPI0028895DF3|nr:hypothetical protein [Proteus columbae]
MEKDISNRSDENTGKLCFSDFFYELDWTLGYSFSIILRITLFLLLLTSSLTLVVLDFYFIFEYQEGISDISTLEIVFIVSVIILFKRYIAYTKVTTVSWWTKLTMPLVWYGCFSWLIWIIFSAFILFSGMNQDDYFILDILIIENYIQVLSFFLMLFSLYISVPSKKYRRNFNICSIKK